MLAAVFALEVTPNATWRPGAWFSGQREMNSASRGLSECCVDLAKNVNDAPSRENALKRIQVMKVVENNVKTIIKSVAESEIRFPFSLVGTHNSGEFSKRNVSRAGFHRLPLPRLPPFSLFLFEAEVTFMVTSSPL